MAFGRNDTDTYRSLTSHNGRTATAGICSPTVSNFRSGTVDTGLTATVGIAGTTTLDMRTGGSTTGTVRIATMDSAGGTPL